MSRNARVIAEGRAVLREVGQADYNFLFGLLTDDEQRDLGRLRSSSISPEQFPSFIWDGVLTQSMLVDGATGEPFGLATIYGANFRHGFAYLGVWSVPSEHRSGRAFLALRAFINNAFTDFPIRKLYAEVLTPNFKQFSGLAGRLFDEEGVLRDHEFVRGGYVDLHLLAVTAARWRQSQDQLASWRTRMTARPDGHQFG